MARLGESPGDDSVALDQLSASPVSPPPKLRQLVNVKILVALFVIYIFVVSDVFTNSITTGFRGAVKCRAPTAFGVVVQGIFLVIFYVLAVYLIQGNII